MAIVLRRHRPRILICALAAIAALVAPGLPSAQALATDGPVDTVSLGGDVVYDMAVLDSGRVIVGGRFTSVGSFKRTNLGAILPSGDADPDFAPTTNGDVYAIAASEDGSRIFIGGRFTQVNGQPRQNLAAINATTGALISGWQADTTGTNPKVTSLAVSGDRLYVGGKYNGIDGTSKQKLAALDASSGNLVRWSTWLNGGVNEVRVSPDGDTVWIGGEFTKIRGVERPYFGGIDADTGQPTAFNGLNNRARVITIAISPDGEWLFVGNNWNRIIAYRVNVSPTPVWQDHGSGNVQAFAVSADTLYLGGHFKGFDDGSVRMGFAAFNRFTGAKTSWDPKATFFHKGTWSLVIDDGRLYAGGGFIKFGSVTQRLFAKFGGTA
jgi:WD40 repeat protein